MDSKSTVGSLPKARADGRKPLHHLHELRKHRVSWEAYDPRSEHIIANLGYKKSYLVEVESYHDIPKWHKIQGSAAVHPVAEPRYSILAGEFQAFGMSKRSWLSTPFLGTTGDFWRPPFQQNHEACILIPPGYLT